MDEDNLLFIDSYFQDLKTTLNMNIQNAHKG